MLIDALATRRASYREKTVSAEIANFNNSNVESNVMVNNVVQFYCYFLKRRRIDRNACLREACFYIFSFITLFLYSIFSILLFFLFLNFLLRLILYFINF